MNCAPQVLVVIRDGDEGTKKRVVEHLKRQTYRETRLVSVSRTKMAEPGRGTGSADVCGEGDFACYLEKADADYVLFWPDEGGLRGAAIEKLVLALQVAPEQDGVADVARGSTGFWMGRLRPDRVSLLAGWMGPQLRWFEECHLIKPHLFHIAEDLCEGSEGASVRQSYAVEHLFGRLAFRSESFQPITAEPLWPMSADEIDERSVLLVVSSLPMGGACKFILDLAGQLKAQGYRVAVATTAYETCNANPWLDELLKILPDVFVLSHSHPVELPRLLVHLARSRQCGRVVISHCMLGYQLLPWLRSELPDVSFLDYTHIEYETEWPKGGYAQRSLHNQSLLDLSLVSSEHLRQWMITRGSEADGVRVCHTNIDTAKWVPDAKARTDERAKLGIRENTPVILYPCRLAEQKRPGLMCNIVAALRRNTKVPFVVVVAGDGVLMPAVRKFVADHELQDCFRVLGAVSLERVHRLHNAADILLLPSQIEGIALALFEAMALESVPVVADVGGQRELVTPDCGYLIPIRDEKWEFADYVTVLRCLVENTSLRQEKASACRARVERHFPLREMTKTFIAGLDEAGRRHARRYLRLPEPVVCRELATLAIDQIRLAHQNFVWGSMAGLLDEKVKKQEKIIAKLRRRVEAASRSASMLLPKENEV